MLFVVLGVALYGLVVRVAIDAGFVLLMVIVGLLIVFRVWFGWVVACWFGSGCACWVASWRVTRGYCRLG